MTSILNRHATDLAAHASRAAQRKQRLLEIEKEQRMEEVEALKMTEEQRQILHRPFSSVKVEFSDLDGMSWRNQTQRSSPLSNTGRHEHPPNQAFVILTNADLATFAPHETIRASASTRPRPRSSVSSPNLSGRPFSPPSSPSTSSTLKHSHSTFSIARSSSSAATLKAILNSRKNSRSPIKGLFSTPPSDAYESDGERTIRGSESDTDDSPRPRKERKKSASHSSPVHASGILSGVTSTVSEATTSTRHAMGFSAPSSPRPQPLPSAMTTLVSWATGLTDGESGCISTPPTSGGALAAPMPHSTSYPAYITYSRSPACPDSPRSLACSSVTSTVILPPA